MERLDSARRVKKWKLSMKSLISSMSCCNVMVRSRRVSRWEDLNRDLLVKIFDKLNVMDITMGASRVCISWFLAAHDKTLWKTIDITDLEPAVYFNPKASHEQAKNKSPHHPQYLRKFLNEVTKFSRTVPKNLFFNFYSYVEEDNLMIAAESVPNIEKFVFPRWCNIRNDTFQFAFSQWKNLHTLIIIEPLIRPILISVEFQVIGENCTNLTNLKYVGDWFIDYSARKIVRCLQNLKRLSFRCSVIRYEDIITLITGLQNLTILNLSHCIFRDLKCTIVPNEDFVQTVTQKLEKLIRCSQDCEICIENLNLVNRNRFDMYTFREKHWQKD